MTRRRRAHATVWLLTLLMLVAPTHPAFAYLKFGYDVNGRSTTLRWPTTPVPYYVSNYDIPNVTSTAFAAAVERAFATWEAAPLSDVAYRFAGLTSALPGQDDGRSTLGFLNEPALDRVLATTSYLIDGVTGELIESDIFFNSAFPWSASESAVANRWDVQTIAVHEIGHFSGLGHSAIGETANAPGGRRVLSSASVMFPIALGAGDISGRTLEPDDLAGISDLYPGAGFAEQTGSVSGRITRNGRGVFGAHVVAFDPSSGAQVGNFTLDGQGRFSIAGLRPGPHLLRVEPLDDAELESFFGGGEPIELAFQPMFFERLVIVPRGGDSGAVSIAVMYTMSVARSLCLTALVGCAGVAPAGAQARPARIEIAAGAGWFGATSYPPINATQAVPGDTRRAVFRTQSSLGSSTGVAVRVGVPMTAVLSAEATFSLNGTTLSTAVSDDSEGAASITASEPVTQYLIEGGVLVRPVRWRHRRLEPFVSGGIGYLRHLNEGRTLVETGSTWYGGGGFHYLLKRAGAGRIRSAGFRFDARLSVLSRGIALDDGRHAVPLVGGAVFVRF